MKIKLNTIEGTKRFFFFGNRLNYQRMNLIFGTLVDTFCIEYISNNLAGFVEQICYKDPNVTNFYFFCKMNRQHCI